MHKQKNLHDYDVALIYVSQVIMSFVKMIFQVDLKSHPCESVLTMDCSPSNTMAITSKPYLQDPSRKVYHYQIQFLS